MLPESARMDILNFENDGDVEVECECGAIFEAAIHDSYNMWWDDVLRRPFILCPQCKRIKDD